MIKSKTLIKLRIMSVEERGEEGVEIGFIFW